MKFLLTFLAVLSLSGAAFAAAPIISDQPDDITVTAGASVSFSAAANIGTIQWQESISATDAFVNVAGAVGTASPLTFTTQASQNGYRYRAIFTNGTDTTTSSIATLTVKFVPQVTNNPASQTKKIGETVTFTADATGNPTPTVQWELSMDAGASFASLVGFTGKTLSFVVDAGQDSFLYRAAFSNELVATPVRTTAAKLTVTTTPTPTPPGGNSAGVLVYNLNFKHIAGFGIDFFEDGYVVVPATGGDGEVVFLGVDKHKRVYSRQSGVKFFSGHTRDDRFSVVSMAGTTGASLSIQAYGKADDKLKANGPTYSITVKAAKTLHGLAQAAYDESKATTQPTDGTLGFVEFAEMKMAVDSKETDKSNENSWTTTTTMDELIKVLEGRGYTKLDLGTTTGTDTGSDTGTGNTTPTTPATN